ncbi:hypothetical protein HYALB_00003369 [Hymenoscyphus albidus]|uniref:Uncharacterized protein n=1 Tax=Hymenoscyphus albidus TaxID=595503 RepID=A0A9N9LNU5_9HELO|nr:hypothetical protein HYALB_00003369 [Hymenoscyphus albidus]
MKSNESPVDVSAPLPTQPRSIMRVPSTTNLQELVPKRARHGRRHSKSQSRQSVRFKSRESSGENISENSQALYMNSRRTRKRAGSYFSSIDNTPIPKLDNPPSLKAELDNANEDLSWSIIDREILEWQYMCETGRPYWWSQEAKYNRFKSLIPLAYNDLGTHSSTNKLDGCPKPIYHERRRAVSESYLVDSSNVNSLAHMIAIQLLGSCFTLPPDQITGTPPTDYAPFDKCDASILPDPGLISSLRLHSHFRYSPCFGHEPRNTSPVQLWPAIYDGPLSPTQPTQNHPESETDTEEARPRQSRKRRPLNVTENSDYSLDSTGGDGHMSRRNTVHAGHEAAAAARRRDYIREAFAHSLSFPRRMTIRGSLERYDRPDPPLNSPMDDEIVNALLPNRSARCHQPHENRLQPVLRSEPHHVFVQPVKELVIKPWRSIRRRVGGSRHSGNCHPTVTPELRRSEVSESGQSCTSTLSLTHEGRARRRRAQERGDIHSSMDSTQHNTTPANEMCHEEAAHALSRPYWLDLESASPKSQTGFERLCGSAESTPYYNTPASGYLTPERGTAQKSDSRNSSPRFQVPDPLAAALAVPNCMNIPNAQLERDAGTASTPLQPPSSPASWLVATPASTGEPIPQLSSAKSPNSGASSTAEVQLRSMQTPPAFHCSSMRIPKRHRRASLLSEVCTPEDFGSPLENAEDRQTTERNVKSTFGSPLATPIEETFPSPVAESCPIPHGSGGPPCIDDVISPGSTSSSSMRTKPRMRRLSISGSQIFTPGDEGVELNGLPTGPGKEMWAAKGGRERTYL